MIFAWLKNRRRAKLLARPFPEQWLQCLTNNVRHYQYLEPSKQAVVRQFVQVFVPEKHWTGCGGLTVSDEMKVTVAAQASLLLLGFSDSYYYDGVPSIILHPRTFARPGDARQYQGTAAEDVWVAGYACRRGPIALSWEAVCASGRDDNGGYNAVLHEFAHHLDGMNGEVEGTPPLSKSQEQDWYRVTETEYLRLVGSAQRNEVAVLRDYGAKNKVEFFAVATECFLERPNAIRREHRELYAVLRDFYAQDPAEWLPDAKARPAPRRAAASDWRESAERERLPTVLASRDTRKLFKVGSEYLENKWYALAAKTFSRIIELKPLDAEAYQQRATARLRLGEYVAALADADDSLRLDPEDLTPYRIRGAACVALRQYDRAKKDLDHMLREHRNDAETFYLRGVAQAGLGHWRRALSDLSMSLAIRPYAAEVYYERARVYRQLRRNKQADADLDKAIQLDPRVGW